MEDSRSNTPQMHYSLNSLDDFTHISGDKFMTSSTKSLYSQVIFHDLSDIYPTDSDIKCTYTLTDNVRPQAGDKIAIFKVGWVSVSDYITFVRAQLPENAETPVLEAVFKAGTFEKKVNELYQLCYVTSGNVVAGASTPFSFHQPHESEFVAVEDPSDPSLLVFRSRVTQLQNDLEKNNEEKESLMMKYRLLEERYHIIREQFDKCEAELSVSKDESAALQTKKEELVAEKTELEKNLKKAVEEISILKQEKNVLEITSENFKKRYEEALNNLAELEEKFGQLCIDKSRIEERCVALQESVNKLNTLLSNSNKEIESLNEIISELEHEKNTFKEKLMEEELNKFAESLNNENQVSLEEFQEKKNELEKEKMKVECLAKEKMSLENDLRFQQITIDNLTLDNRTLDFKLKEMSVKHNKSIAEIHALTVEVSNANLQINNLHKENDELRVVLNEKTEHGPQYLRLQSDKDLLRAQFENLQLHHEKYQREKQIELDEMKVTYERELIESKKQITELKSKLAAFENQQQQQPSSSSANSQRNFSRIKDPASQIFEVITDACSHVQNVFENKLLVKNQTTATETSSNNEVEKLKEKLKVLLSQKAELSEYLAQEKHTSTELDRVMKEIREENAALKSRIAVLEYELATVKNISTQADSFSTTTSVDIESLNKNLTEFTKLMAEQKILEQKLEEEKNAKIFLQTKIEFLLQEDAKMSNKLQEISEKYYNLIKEKDELTKSLQSENVEVLQRALDDNDATINELKEKLDKALKEKETMIKTINDLRVEMVGKITVENLAEYKFKMAELERELQKKKEDCFFMAKFIREGFRDNATRQIICPLCPSEFPYSAREAFVEHFDNHMS